MIIDCHCHAGKGDGLTGPWDTDAPLEQYLLRAAQRRASTARSSSPPSTPTTPSPTARWRGSWRSRPDRFYGFAFVHPTRDRGRDRRRWSARRSSSYGFRGIKVHRHDARITREICEAARALRCRCSTT